LQDHKKLANRYIKALTEGHDAKACQVFLDEMQAFKPALEGDLEVALKHPAIHIDTKTDIIRGVVDKLGLSKITKNFLTLLQNRGRLYLLPTIIDVLVDKIDLMNNVKRIHLVTAVTLEKNQKENFIKDFEKAWNTPLKATFDVDPSILGGVVATLDGKVFDNSVKRRMEKMNEALLA